MQKNKQHSYGQILKSSSIIGGAQGVNYLIGMVRTKLVAILLGPSGVGLVGLYVSAVELVGTVARMGINDSGVREVAEAHGSGDPERVARMVKTLRRACWVTGALGWLLTVALAYPLSRWTFGSGERTIAIAVLGIILLLSSISGGQVAILQGTRRIADIARLHVTAVLVATIVAVGLYAWLGERGIVPVLIATAAVNLALAWCFTRRVPIAPLDIGWADTWRNSKRLFSLGISLTYGAILAALVGVAIRALIVRKCGIEANGIYQAAWGLSGAFAGFILGAMFTDFYPRITAVGHDNDQVNRLVNEQIEIGILLALPGLLATLSYSPWLMRVFYTAKFLPGAELLPLFVLGIFGQVASWPLGIIQRAKGLAGWVILSQTHVNVANMVFTTVLIRYQGLKGVALAFALHTGWHAFVTFLIAKRLTHFSWTTETVTRLFAVSAAFVIGSFIARMWLDGVLWVMIGTVFTIIAFAISLRGIATRLGSGHRMVQLACRIPGGRLACGI